MPHKKGYIDLLLQYYKSDSNLFGVEIGLWQGEFSRDLLNFFPNLKMISIEPFVQWEEVIQNTKNFNKRFTVMPLHSDIAANILQGQYDFIFIDGDHSYEQCRKDIVNYLRFVKPGGILSGHNYHISPNSAHPGVHKSVSEIFGNKVKFAEDYTWYVQV